MLLRLPLGRVQVVRSRHKQEQELARNRVLPPLPSPNRPDELPEVYRLPDSLKTITLSIKAAIFQRLRESGREVSYLQISLEEIDELRRRAGIGYSRARELLKQAGGDLLEALVLLEESSEKPLQVISSRGRDTVAWVRRLAGGLHRSRVKVEVKGNTVMEFPASLRQQAWFSFLNWRRWAWWE